MEGGKTDEYCGGAKDIENKSNDKYEPQSIRCKSKGRFQLEPGAARLNGLLLQGMPMVRICAWHFFLLGCLYTWAGVVRGMPV
jgi:hypothetical protein